MNIHNSEKINVSHQDRPVRAKAKALRIAYMFHDVFSIVS